MKAINDVLHLYYGMQCVIASGVAETTIVKRYLCEFPTKDDLASGMSKSAVAEELREIYE